jgi:hypothetical protein
VNQQLAKDIWYEKLAVEYGDTGNDYGNYTLGENTNKNIQVIMQIMMNYIMV